MENENSIVFKLIGYCSFSLGKYGRDRFVFHIYLRTTCSSLWLEHMYFYNSKGNESIPKLIIIMRNLIFLLKMLLLYGNSLLWYPKIPYNHWRYVACILSAFSLCLPAKKIGQSEGILSYEKSCNYFIHWVSMTFQ